MPDHDNGAPETQTPPETGYATVNGLQMYYEVHGSGGTPLLLLQIPASGPAAGPARQARQLRPGLHGLARRRHSGNRRADPHHRR